MATAATCSTWSNSSRSCPTPPARPRRVTELLARRAALYDNDREEHYNLISALHKSLRGSDADAALYWFARMLAGGEDPRYIARRLVRFAAEDIGLADPRPCRRPWPPGRPMSASAAPRASWPWPRPSSTSAPRPNPTRLISPSAAMRAARDTGSLMPPTHILNAPTKLMKTLGYGAGYAYDHDAEDAFSAARIISPTTCPAPRSTSPRIAASNANSANASIIGQIAR